MLSHSPLLETGACRIAHTWHIYILSGHLHFSKLYADRMGSLSVKAENLLIADPVTQHPRELCGHSYMQSACQQIISWHMLRSSPTSCGLASVIGLFNRPDSH